jgi:hypothetical protein
MAHFCPACDEVCTCSGDTESAAVGTLAGCFHTLAGCERGREFEPKDSPPFDELDVQ